MRKSGLASAASSPHPAVELRGRWAGEPWQNRGFGPDWFTRFQIILFWFGERGKVWRRLKFPGCLRLHLQPPRCFPASRVLGPEGAGWPCGPGQASGLPKARATLHAFDVLIRFGSMRTVKAWRLPSASSVGTKWPFGQVATPAALEAQGGPGKRGWLFEGTLQWLLRGRAWAAPPGPQAGR